MKTEIVTKVISEVCNKVFEACKSYTGYISVNTSHSNSCVVFNFDYKSNSGNFSRSIDLEFEDETENIASDIVSDYVDIEDFNERVDQFLNVIHEIVK